MVYPFMTLPDKSEIVHSEQMSDGSVKVYIEKPDARLCFCHASCLLPGYCWSDVYGFTAADIARYEEIIRSCAHLIIEFSRDGGFENASGF